MMLGLIFGQTKHETRVYELPRFNFDGATEMYEEVLIPSYQNYHFL